MSRFNPYLVLAASLLVALGGWITTLETWYLALEPSYFGNALMVGGGVLLAWLGKSPIKPRI